MTRRQRTLCAFFSSTTLLALVAGGHGAQVPLPYRPDRPIAIVGGLLIDATGAPPRWDQTVLIRGERIAEVGPMEQVKLPEGAEVIDASGMTVMPGLINSNQHIQLNPLYPSPVANLPLAAFQKRWEANWAKQPYRAWVYLMQGVTSMRNTSGPVRRILPVKQAIDRGEIPGPRLFLGAALLQSEASFRDYVRREGTPADAVEFVRNEFAYAVLRDLDRDTKPYEGPEFNYWKLLMSSEPWDGKNDFTDEELRFLIGKARRLGKKIDVHAGSSNAGLRRMLAFDFDTLEHPFYRHELIERDIIDGFVRKGVAVDTLLIQMISVAQHAADPHGFDETRYIMSMDPAEYRVLMHYRDRMLANRRNPEEPGVPHYDRRRPPDFPEIAGQLAGEDEVRSLPHGELIRRVAISKENMRRFIKAGAKFAMGTDTGAFLNFQQENPNAAEMMLMVEMGIDPMAAIQASTRNGAEILGQPDQLGTLEAGKLADVIVVAGNPLREMAAMKRVAYVIKGGVRFK